jgi:nicotinamidase-related amidase
VSSALVAVHYQNDVVHPEGKLDAAVANPALIPNARRLLRGARAGGVAVVSVRIAFPPEGTTVNAPIFAAAVERCAVVEGSWGAEFHEQLAPAPGEPVVTHARVSAFHDSDLERVLRDLGVDRLVVAGVATHSAVEHTARHASDLGYEVVVAEDACASADAELHAAALRVLRPHVARVATVDEVLGEFGG